MTLKNRKIIVAVTGASGAVYAQELLRKLGSLKNPPGEIAVIFSDIAKEIWEYETGAKYVPESPAKEFDNKTFNAPFASGSSHYDTMIICPASMGTTGRIANGTSDDLIARAADVILKEKRKTDNCPKGDPLQLYSY